MMDLVTCEAKRGGGKKHVLVSLFLFLASSRSLFPIQRLLSNVLPPRTERLRLTVVRVRSAEQISGRGDGDVLDRRAQARQKLLVLLGSVPPLDQHALTPATQQTAAFTAKDTTWAELEGNKTEANRISI